MRAGHGEDVVLTFSFDSWGDAVRRGMHRPPERLALTLMSSPRVARLLVVNPFRSAPVRLARTVLRTGDPRFPASERHSLYTPLRLVRHDPVDVPRLVQSCRAWDARVGKQVRARGLSAPTVITTNPFLAAWAEARWARDVVFYARDDWSELPAKQPWWPAYRASYRELAANGRPVMAVSQQIIDRIAPSGRTLVAPNGINVEEWTGPAQEPPRSIADATGTRAVYVGTLDTRIDVDGLLHVAETHPELQVFLIGPMEDARHLERLLRHPRMHFPGALGRPELVAALRAADVCLIAHNRTRLTEAMSPLKLYEYLAAGRPVLSPAFGPVRDVSPRVHLTPDVAAFADALPRVVSDGPAPEQDRLRFVQANSWASRHETMLDFALGA